MAVNDVIGQIYGSIEILRRATKEETPWKSHSTPFWAHCVICGVNWVIRKEDIGKDCPYCKGVGRGHIDKSIIGQRFGLLTVKDVYSDDKQHNYRTMLLCQCACGNKYRVAKQHVIQGRKHKDGYISYTISCGCASRSLGEINTEYAIKELGYDYRREQIVKECHAYSPFDIEMIDPKTKERICFFECDGIQHFQCNNRFYNGNIEEFIHRQEIDKIKNQWCKDNKILLCRIPYTDYPIINREYLLNRFPELKELLEKMCAR